MGDVGRQVLVEVRQHFRRHVCRLVGEDHGDGLGVLPGQKLDELVDLDPSEEAEGPGLALLDAFARRERRLCSQAKRLCFCQRVDRQEMVEHVLDDRSSLVRIDVAEREDVVCQHLDLVLVEVLEHTFGLVGPDGEDERRRLLLGCECDHAQLLGSSRRSASQLRSNVAISSGWRSTSSMTSEAMPLISMASAAETPLAPTRAGW